MTPVRCDALVLFGISGDLAFRKILPAVYSLFARQQLDLPVIGVARGEFDLPRLIARLRESLQQAHLKVDPAACARLEARLAFVQGDYHDSAAYVRLREALAGCQHPLYYLAIPPSLFPVVIGGLDHAGAARGARVVVEKPFGRDLAGSRALNRVLHGVFRERDVFRIDHYLGKEAVQNLLYFRFANSFLEPVWNRHYIDNIQVTLAEKSGVGSRGLFYEEAGAIRDVIQNHLLQVLACLTMEAPTGDDIEAVRDEKAKLLRAVRPLEARNVVCGQYRGYRQEAGVAPESRVETYAAVRLEIHNWRWAGVPVYLRSGKNLPMSATEVMVEFRRPPQAMFGEHHLGYSNYLRFRLSPDVAIAMGARVKAPGEGMRGETVELFAMHQHPEEAGPYERLLLDAVHGDPGLFAREDEVDAAWRIVDPVLAESMPVYDYAAGSWGPEEAGYFVNRPGGWHPLRMDSVNRAIF
ncbi:glucose-6-phosphate dehydrogenase [Laribacter hongkongensis]|uniref:glucose-6-phosphate dehydrogenase n=1 Tax=Laribacter hongkongensis TaxID=168471 RepID=UPI001EFD081B|nr:glucose-6-phosphate dehydrogenase [Laribacter hongkongensis]MCG9075993.1 glucose-6-phosphate dehydrogenase [Laribacter hongkongensis]